MPSEPELIDAYGVSKTTANEALRMLVAEGLVVRHTGTGSFVAEEVPELARVRIKPGAIVYARHALDGETVTPGVMVFVVEDPDTGRSKVYPCDQTVIHVPGADCPAP